MRLFRRLSCLAPLLVPLAPAVLLACFDSSNPSPPGNETPQPDGRVPVADATTPDAPATPDGGTSPEAAADAIPETGSADDPAAAPRPVTVLVQAASGPEAGRMVVFSDASGQVLDTLLTDATGVATRAFLASQAPLQVTVILGSAGQANLFTVTGVQPGDTLTAFDASASVTATVEVSAPPVVDAGTISGYDFYAGSCTSLSNTTQAELSLSAGCVGPNGVFPVLALAEGTDGPVAYLSQKNTLASDAGSTTTLNLSGSWQYSMGTATVDVTNVPDGEYPSISYTEVAAGVPYANYDPEPAVTNQSHESTFETHPAYPDFVQTEVDVGGTVDGGTGLTTLAIANRADPPTAASPSPSVTFDNTEFLPSLTSASVDASNPARPTVSWTAASPLTTGVAAFVSVHWSSTDDAGAAVYGTWTIVTAASAAAPSVQLPLLPDAASAYGPGAAAVWPADNPTVAVLAGPAAGTYDTLRRTAAVIGANLDPFNVPLIPPLPLNGRAQVSLFYQQIPQLLLRRR